MNKKVLYCCIAGLISGIVSGLFSTGGGMILVPFLTLAFEENEIRARSTTIFCIFFIVIVSTIVYGKSSAIDWNISIKCSFGGVLGGIIGSKLLVNLNKRILRFLFIVFLIYTGVKMII